MASKEHILSEIRRTAKENGGKPVGRGRFVNLTGTSEYDVLRYWPRYGDAIREAGLEPNVLNTARDDDEVLEQFVQLTEDLGHVPTLPELRLARIGNPSFPSTGVFERLGSKNERIGRALEFSRQRPVWGDVTAILEAAYVTEEAPDAQEPSVDQSRAASFGFVYLARGHRGEFKIGHTNLVGRRLGELGVTAAVEPTLIHEIKTDDPVGVEAYWHRRFADKRLRGEWFGLSAADVAAFKRWRRIL